MDIGIIGSGQIGGTLARGLAALGHRVRIANSRGPESLAALAAETGATASTVEQAAGARDVVIVAIPEKAVPKLPGGFLAGSAAVVVDTGNYYPSRDGRIDAIEGGLTDSGWVAGVLGRPVVKAFNNIVARSLASRGLPGGSTGRVCLSVAGDDPAAKQVALRLIDELGFDGLDGGSLAESWRQQPGTPAYCRDLDRAALRAALAEPDAAGIADRRRAADEQARRFFETR
jgi:8-hydroxy-5-deazaflavin:NADPH oxidoreductase